MVSFAPSFNLALEGLFSGDSLLMAIFLVTISLGLFIFDDFMDL